MMLYLRADENGLFWNQPVNLSAFYARQNQAYREHDAARENFIKVHGHKPPDWFDVGALLRDYSHIPTMEELHDRLTALDARLSAASRQKPRDSDPAP